MDNKPSIKEGLLSTAIDLFIKHGFDQVTINQICKEVAVTKTAFYYYYKSKDELIIDFFSSSEMISNEDLMSIFSAQDYANQILKLMEINIKHIVRAGYQLTKEFYRVTLRNEMLALAPDQTTVGNIIITLIQRAQEAGQIKNMAPAAEIHRTLCYISNGVSLYWSMSNGNFDVMEESRNRFKTLLMLDS